MAMDFARVFELVKELDREESNIKYVRQMRCDHYHTWYTTVRIEPPRYQELIDTIAREKIFQCRCCGEKVSYFGLEDKTEGNYRCWTCAPDPWEYNGDDFDEEEFEA